MGDDQWRSGHHESLDLPPGFRFHPTDEEIITYYLTPKVLDRSFSATAVGEVDLNKSEPWDLPSKAKMGEKEWYFYCQKDRKYPTGMRTNRATEAGYWKATGKDREIYRGRGVLVGMKKTLVFYKGRAPKGMKTNWVMHEYRLEGRLPYPNLDSLRSSKDEWAVCRVFHKSVGVKKVVVPMAIGGGIERSLSMSIGDDFLVDATTLPPLMDPSSYFATAAGASTSTASPPPPASSYFTSLASGFSSNPALHVSHFGKPAAAALPPPVFYQQMGAGAGPGRLVAAPASFAYAHSNDGGRSQDTGLSTEHNTAAEASSVVSASSAAAGVDVGGVWKY